MDFIFTAAQTDKEYLMTILKVILLLYFFNNLTDSKKKKVLTGAGRAWR